MKKAGLTPKQAMFVKEYLVDLSATRAAIRAGYSEKRADAIGYENLRKPEISEAIQAAMAERGEKVEITAENVLKSILSIRDMAVKSDKLSEALKANELLGKHLGMFTDKIHHSGDINLSGVLRVPVVAPEEWLKANG